MGLSWKEDHPPILDHYTVCLNHLRFLQHKLLKTPELLKEYDSIIQDQLDKGIIEPLIESAVDSGDSTRMGKSIYYLCNMTG